MKALGSAAAFGAILAMLAYAAHAATADGAATSEHEQIIMRHDLSGLSGNVLKLSSKGAIRIGQRFISPEVPAGAEVAVEIGFDGRYGLELLSATPSGSDWLSIWSPRESVTDGTLTLSIAAKGEALSQGMEFNLSLLPGTCSGWIRAPGEASRDLPRADLETTRDTVGIGSCLSLSTSPQGRVRGWRLPRSVTSGFTPEEQRKLVCLISGIVVPVFPVEPVRPGDKWRLTPGEQAAAVLTPMKLEPVVEAGTEPGPADRPHQFSEEAAAAAEAEAARREIAGSIVNQETARAEPGEAGEAIRKDMPQLAGLMRGLTMGKPQTTGLPEASAADGGQRNPPAGAAPRPPASGGGMSDLGMNLGGGDIFNPFGWSIPIEYTHEGFTSEGGRRLARLSFKGDVRDAHLSLDQAVEVVVPSVTVTGEMLFDPDRGVVASVTATCALEAVATARNELPVAVTLSATTTAVWAAEGAASGPPTFIRLTSLR